MELLVGIAVGGVFIIGIATIVAPSLRANQQAGKVQIEAELGSELMDNMRAWAAGNWNNIFTLATGTANTYSLTTTASPFTATLGTVTSTGYATPSFVQGTSTDGYNVSSLAVTLKGTTVTAGDIIAVDVFVGKQTTSLNSVTANCVTGNFTLVNNSTTYSNKSYAAMGYGVVSTTSSTCKITATLSGASGNALVMAAHEITNVVTSSPLDGSAMLVQSGPGTGANAIKSGNITTTQGNDYVFGVTNNASNDGGFASTTGSGYAFREYDVNGMLTEDEIQPSATSTAATFTSVIDGGFASFITGIMAFKAPTAIVSSTYLTTSTESITLGGNIYTRNFYLSDVYRDSNGNVTTTIAGNYYDPSTKLVTIIVKASSTPSAAPLTFSFYLTRGQDDTFYQTSWAGGSGQSTPVTVAGTNFASGTNIAVTATGTIELSTGGGSCTL